MESDTVMSLGQRVKTLREIRGNTQETLAKLLKVTPQHISAIELDKRLPSINFLAVLAKELDTTTDYLITGKNNGHHGTIPAILADKNIPDEAKKALIDIIKYFASKQS